MSTHASAAPLRHAFCSAVAALAVLAAHLSTPAQAQTVAIDVDDRTGRASAVRNIGGDGEGCARATEAGVVTTVQRGRSGLIEGIRWRGDRFGNEFINVEHMLLKASRADIRRIDARLGELLVPGVRLRLETFGCGAGGRVSHLNSVTLLGGAIRESSPRPVTQPAEPLGTGASIDKPLAVGPGVDPLRSAPADTTIVATPAPVVGGPATPAPREGGDTSVSTPGGGGGDARQAVIVPRAAGLPWRQKSYTPGRSHAIEFKSARPRFGITIECLRFTTEPVRFAVYLDTPRDFVITDGAGKILFDDVDAKVELSGSEDVVIVSDAENNNAVAVTPQLRQRLLATEKMTFIGRTLRGQPRRFVVNLAPSVESLADFEARCAALRPPARRP
jgi:hypothetical protein